MRHYEIVLLIHPDQSEQVPAMLGRYKDMVVNQIAPAGKSANEPTNKPEKGIVHRVEDWGRRRLAYIINDVHKAHYLMLNVECNLETLRELEKNFKFNDSIIRSLIIRCDHASTDESALAKAKAAEDRAEAEKRVAREVAEAADEVRQKAAALKAESASKDEDKSKDEGASKADSKDASEDKVKGAKAKRDAAADAGETTADVADADDAPATADVANADEVPVTADVVDAGEAPVTADVDTANETPSKPQPETA